MLISGQNAVRAYRKSWPIVPGLADSVRPIRQVVALEHHEKDLALYLDAHPGYLDCGADPVTNGNFEGAPGPPPANWLVLTGTGTRIAGTRPGGTGLFCGELSFLAAAHGYLYQLILTPGQTYSISGWVYSVGGGIPRVGDDGGLNRWVGVAGAWQTFTTLLYPTTAAFYLHCANLAAGVTCVWDDVTITPLNVTTWNSRTRNGGRSPTQATAALRPVRSVGGLPSSRDCLYYDGNARRLKSPAFTLNQPETVAMILRHDFQATGRYVIDGNASDSMACYRPTGLNRIDAYAGANLAGPAIATATWYSWIAGFNGAASTECEGIGTLNTGNTGAGNAGGFTAGSVGAGGSYWVGDTGQIIISTRVLSASESINIARAAMRRACI